jgi:hypothetical protein
MRPKSHAGNILTLWIMKVNSMNPVAAEPPQEPAAGRGFE